MVAEGDPVVTQVLDETNALISVDKPKGVATYFTLHLKGKMRPRTEDTKFEFGLTVAGRAKVLALSQITTSISNWYLVIAAVYRRKALDR